MSTSPTAELATFAPPVATPPNFLPTGNLSIALPEIDIDDGAVRSLGVVLSSCAGVLTARGSDSGLARPVVRIDDALVELGELRWSRAHDWLPTFTATLAHGRLTGSYLPPADERGVALRLRYEHHDVQPRRVELGWTGSWAAASVEHLRSKPVSGTWAVRDDSWTATRVVSLSTGLPLLAIAWRAGAGVRLDEGDETAGWRASASGSCGPGDELCADVFIGVAPEVDGACATALHLRRRGFPDLWEETTGWLAEHQLSVPDNGPLQSKLNANLFFSWFYAQADTLDDGCPVLLTSRSPHYYVCAAFWSRDAYCWTFPALLLVDHRRARIVLLSTLRAGAARLPDHALYLNGTSLYPGFELDQAAAPILAVARYVLATADWTVLDEPGVADTMFALVRRIEAWRHPEWALYATFLLPTDDPTDYPYVTTDNALVAAAFDALANLVDGAQQRGSAALVDSRYGSDGLRRLARDTRSAMSEHLVVDGRHGPMWAWACDRSGATDLRDEPPLGLRTLPYWGAGEWSDRVNVATRDWLRDDYEHQYGGPFGGSGAPHFPYPSGFDLANRLLDLDSTEPDPVAQFTETPMDQGLACESWDRDTGRVATGAAMASMAGLLVWAFESRRRGDRRWDGG